MLPETLSAFDDSSVTPVYPMQVVDESRLWSTKAVEGMVSNQVGTAICTDRQVAAREIASGRMIKFHMLNILSASRPAQRVVCVIFLQRLNAALRCSTSITSMTPDSMGKTFW